MHAVTLDEVTEINPPADKSDGSDEVVSFVGMAQLDASTGRTTTGEDRVRSSLGSGYTAFARGDVLVAKITPCFENGKIGIATIARSIGFGSSEFHVLRPVPNTLDARYLKHFLRQKHINALGQMQMTGTGGQQRVPRSFLRNLEIPLPPIADQMRIADILDQAEFLAVKRREALELVGQLLQSMFLETFGDPIANPKSLPCESLTDVCDVKSGSTPSKAEPRFWNGDLPWFSARDMKQPDLFDSRLHLDRALAADAGYRIVPANTVAIVVRGMILAHTFPVCVLRSECAINQDLKALVPRVELDSQFLAACLRAQSPAILAGVLTSAHGTKRIDANGLKEIRVLLPDLASQHEFLRKVEKRELLARSMGASQTHLNELLDSLKSRAFRGEL